MIVFVQQWYNQDCFTSEFVKPNAFTILNNIQTDVCFETAENLVTIDIILVYRRLIYPTEDMMERIEDYQEATTNGMSEFLTKALEICRNCLCGEEELGD